MVSRDCDAEAVPDGHGRAVALRAPRHGRFGAPRPWVSAGNGERGEQLHVHRDPSLPHGRGRWVSPGDSSAGSGALLGAVYAPHAMPALAAPLSPPLRVCPGGGVVG